MMIVASFFFSIMGALVKYSLENVAFMEAVFFRATVTLILVVPWMLYKKIRFIGKNLFILFIRSASGFTALCLSFYILDHMILADASILNRTSVPFVAVLSIFFLKERVNMPLFSYTICAFIGAALIIKPSFNFLNIPGLLGLAAGFLAAIAYISLKHLHKTESFFTIVFSFAFFSSVTSFLLSYSNFVWPENIDLLALIGVGLCGTIAQLTMTYSYKYMEASVVSPYSFSTIIFSALWGFLFWSEIPDQWSLFGGTLIIVCGIGIMKLKKSKGETFIEYEEDLADQTENRI